MKSTIWGRVLLIVLVLTIAALDAAAWGPKAQRGIMGTSLSFLRRTYSQEFFKDGTFVFGSDLFKGAEEGRDIVLPAKEHRGKKIPQGITTEIALNEEQILLNITGEIQLLREVRKYGVGSYYAYRMGALAAVVADLYLPFSLEMENIPNVAILREKVAQDTDAHVKSFIVHEERREMNFLATPAQYLAQETRQFAAGAAVLVADDYATGLGYDGYMKEAAPKLYNRAILSVADVWNTVLKAEGKVAENPTSDEAITWYLVKQVDYLLNVKKNPVEADRAYTIFATVNPGIIAANEKVGESYYKSGDKERGVEEWRTATTFSGPERERIIGKISTYYMERGEDLVASATDPKAPENALGDAVEAFEEAVRVDRGNPKAADALAKAREEKKNTDDMRDAETQIIAKARSLAGEADKSRVDKKYEESVSMYQNVMLVAEGVSGRFEKLKKEADDITSSAKVEIGKIMEEVIDEAETAIDDGDSLLTKKQFDQAELKFQSVAGILSIIPDDPDHPDAKTKKGYIETATKRMDDVKKARERAKKEEEMRKAQPPAAAPGATGTTPKKPAAGGMATPPGMPAMPMMPPMGGAAPKAN